MPVPLGGISEAGMFLHSNDQGDTIDETGRIVNPDGSEPSSDDLYHQKCGCGHLKIDHFATGECCFSNCDCEQFDLYDYMLSVVRVPPELLSGTIWDRSYSQPPNKRVQPTA